MLEWQNVSLKGQPPRLTDINLRLTPGQLTIVLGPNGAGKSSFLSLTAGLSKPSSGSVLWKGLPLSAWSARDLARFRAFLSQTLSLPFAMTAAELVRLGRFPHASRSPGEEEQIIAQALELCQATPLASRRSDQLSGGELQRVHTARVLAQAWEAQEKGEGLLLLDEPTASLDPQYQHATLQVAQAMAARGLTVIAVLHDLNLAARYADRIIFLKRGRLLAEGPAREILQEDLIREVFDVEVCLPQNTGLKHPALITLGPRRDPLDFHTNLKIVSR